MKLTNAYIIDGDVIEKRDNQNGWSYTHNEVIERISSLAIDCPECEDILHSDEQYQCNTCGGGGKINVLSYFKKNLKPALPIVEEVFESGWYADMKVGESLEPSKQDFLTKDF
jgi:hypothetical protein